MEGQQESATGWSWPRVALIGGSVLFISGGIYFVYRRWLRGTWTHLRAGIIIGDIENLIEEGKYKRALHDLWVWIERDEATICREHLLLEACCDLLSRSCARGCPEYRLAKKITLKIFDCFRSANLSEIQPKHVRMTDMLYLLSWNHDYDIAEKCISLLENFYYSVDDHRCIAQVFYYMSWLEHLKRNIDDALDVVERAPYELRIANYEPESNTDLLYFAVTKCRFLLSKGTSESYAEALELIQSSMNDCLARGWEPTLESRLFKTRCLAAMGLVEDAEAEFKELQSKFKGNETATLSLYGHRYSLYVKHQLEKKAAKMDKKIRNSARVPPITSEFFETEFYGFVWREGNKNSIETACVVGVQVLNPLIAAPLFIEIQWEFINDKKIEPIITEMEYSFVESQSAFWKNIFLMKSPFRLAGLHSGDKILVVAKFFLDREKENLFTIHRQYVTVDYPLTKITRKAAEEFYMEDFELD